MTKPAVLNPQLVRLLGVAVVATFYVGIVTVGTDAAFGDRDQTTTAAGGQDLTAVGSAGGIAGGDGSATAPDDAGAAPINPSDSSSGPAAPGPGSAAGGGDHAAPPAPNGGAGGAGGPAAGPAPTPGRPAPQATGAVRIGVHDDNPGAAFGQFGVRGGPSGDQGQWVRALVEWINANGGMGGRPVELVHHVTESLNGTFDQQAERACSFFTEDNDVLAVVGGARVPTLNLVDCLAKHDTPLVWSYHYMADQATFDRYANYLYMPAMVTADRLGVWMDALADDGFFKGGTIGIVRNDDRIHDFLSSSVLRPALAKKGLKVKEEVALRPATGTSSAADLSAQASNAILRFRSAGVDRVIMQPTSAVVPLLFFAAAESQSYRPRYTMTSFDIPSFQNANAPASQLHGSVAFGWLPSGDVDWEQQPQPLPPAAQQCVEITKGADPPGNSSVRRFCDGLFFLKFLLDKGAEPTTAGIRQAVDALGSSYPSAWTYGTAFGAKRHDGATIGRLVDFDDKCGCYKITGKNRTIPVSAKDRLADDLVDALGRYDADAVDKLADPGLVHWNNLSQREQGLEGLLATLRAERGIVADATFSVKRRMATDEGFVLELTVDGATLGGRAFHIPVCLVVTVDEGRISRIDEYADSAAARPIVEELFG